MRVCFLVNSKLGIPAVNGGAIETIIDMITSTNEKIGKCEIYVVSPYTMDIKQRNSMMHTTYIYIMRNHKIKKVLQLINNDKLNDLVWQLEVFFQIWNERFDVIINEMGPLKLLYRWKKFFWGTKKFLFHMHWEEKDLQRLVNVYDGFIAISPYIYKQASKYVDEKNIYLLNNCIDTKLFSRKLLDQERIFERRKYSIKDEAFVFLYCGRTIPEKGVKELILAFKSMPHRDKCLLWIVGNSGFGNKIVTEYDKELFKLSEGENIIFYAYIPNSELYKVHNIIDVSVVPSIWEEPMGLVVLEGLCAGNAMIVSDSGSIPDFVDEKSAIIIKRDNNYVISLAEAMEYLYLHPEICKNMGKEGARIAKKYSQEVYYDDFIKCLNYFRKGDN